MEGHTGRLIWDRPRMLAETPEFKGEFLGLGCFATIAYESGLEIKDVGQFGDEGSFDHFSGGTAPLVVDQEEVAERLVDEVEADVAGDFLDGAVVLDQSVQEHIGAKGVAPAGGHQMGREVSGR